jgi:hypothetical protein
MTSVRTKPMNAERLRRRIFTFILFFIVALILSGITAFPLSSEIRFLQSHRDLFPPTLKNWIDKIAEGIIATDEKYPFILYGTDWLAFSHIVIATAFIGPLRDPVKNKWIIEWGIIACIMIIPLAIIAGHIRNIPFFHQVIDCSFGIIGLIPLMIVHHDICKLENLENIRSLN